MSNAHPSNAPLRSIVDTPITESLLTDLFNLQRNDGSFPLNEQLGRLFGVHFETIQNELKDKGLDGSIAQDVHQFIATASILFYFLYNSQKAKFPVDFAKIQSIIDSARQEFGKMPTIEDQQLRSYIEKGEAAVDYIIRQREKYNNLCQDLKLSSPTWEGYIQQRMGLA